MTENLIFDFLNYVPLILFSVITPLFSLGRWNVINSMNTLDSKKGEGQVCVLLNTPNSSFLIRLFLIKTKSVKQNKVRLCCLNTLFLFFFFFIRDSNFDLSLDFLKNCSIFQPHFFLTQSLFLFFFFLYMENVILLELNLFIKKVFI